MKVLKITVLTRFHFIVNVKSSRLVVCHEMCRGKVVLIQYVCTVFHRSNAALE